MLIAGRTWKERYEENKEAILENKKVYYERNRDKLRQVNECECGGRFSYDSKSHHFKTKMHQTYLANLNYPAE